MITHFEQVQAPELLRAMADAAERGQTIYRMNVSYDVPKDGATRVELKTEIQADAELLNEVVDHMEKELHG